jgi:hypothetical protein
MEGRSQIPSLTLTIRAKPSRTLLQTMRSLSRNMKWKRLNAPSSGKATLTSERFFISSSSNGIALSKLTTHNYSSFSNVCNPTLKHLKHVSSTTSNGQFHSAALVVQVAPKHSYFVILKLLLHHPQLATVI